MVGREPFNKKEWLYRNHNKCSKTYVLKLFFVIIESYECLFTTDEKDTYVSIEIMLGILMAQRCSGLR